MDAPARKRGSERNC